MIDGYNIPSCWTLTIVLPGLYPEMKYYMFYT